MNKLSDVFDNTKTNKPKICPCGLIGSALFKAQVDAHITHLLQKDKTLARHEAMQKFYEEVEDLVDSFIEKYSGLYTVSNLSTGTCSNIEEPVKYFTTLYAAIEKFRVPIKESFLQNEIDNIQGLIAQTLYRLKDITT